MYFISFLYTINIFLMVDKTCFLYINTFYLFSKMSWLISVMNNKTWNIYICVYDPSKLCKIELESGISCLISTHRVNWNNTLGTTLEFSKLCVSSEADLFLDPLNNVHKFFSMHKLSNRTPTLVKVLVYRKIKQKVAQVCCQTCLAYNF